MEEKCRRVFEEPRYGYAVMGECGEGYDWHRWLVCVYLNESEAQAHAGFAKQRALKLYGPKDRGEGWSIGRYIDMQSSRHKGGLKNEYDPDMDIDYTGTTYDVEKVILAF